MHDAAAARLATLAAAALLAGAAVYATGRPAPVAPWVGCAPSALHTFAFTIATALVMPAWPVLRAAALWVLINGAVECAQHPAWPDALRAAGRFDALDLLGTLAGATAAALLVHAQRRQRC